MKSLRQEIFDKSYSTSLNYFPIQISALPLPIFSDNTVLVASACAGLSKISTTFPSPPSLRRDSAIRKHPIYWHATTF